jgi:TolA-binding protein
MVRRITFFCLAAAVFATAAPARAQNRVEQQLFLEIRTLQSQVQRLQVTITTLTEQLAKAEGRVDSVTKETLEGFANQKLLIDSLAASVRALSERQSDTSVQVLALTQEMKAIREGLTKQQDSLSQIITLLQESTIGGGAMDPNAPPLPGLTKPGDTPPSPAEYYRAAFQYYYEGKWEAAHMALTEAIKRFPDSPEAGRAQITIAESYRELTRNEDALAAFATAIKTYKEPEILAEAYMKQGLLQERMGQKTEAIKSLQQGYKVAPAGSSMYLLIEGNLKRLGVIKGGT